jgi:ssRNA-specific RNase YbeY (16S rRNA maturation enzyme)
MLELNTKHRRKKKPTDVLSFRLLEVRSADSRVKPVHRAASCASNTPASPPHPPAQLKGCTFVILPLMQWSPPGKLTTPFFHGVPLLMGEVVLCPRYIEREHDLAARIPILLVHAALHLQV